MSQGQSKWTEIHKEKHPQDESRRKERQRQKDSILRFHIARNIRSKIPIPDSVDTTSEAFLLAKKRYMMDIEAPVEKIET